MHENNARRRLKILAVSLFAVVLASGCAPVDPEREMAEAVNSFDAGRYSEADIRLSNVIQAQPANAEAWKLRGEIALLTGDAERAVDALDRARALGVPSISVAVVLADAHLMLGQSAEALAILDSAGESLEGDPNYWVARAEALVRAGRPAEAELTLDTGASVGAGGMRADVVRALIAFARNDPSTAEALLSRSIEASSDAPLLLTARAELFARTDRLAEAAADFLRAADLYRAESLDVREITVLMGLAQVNLARNDLDAAEATVLRIVERAPDVGLTAYLRGLIEYRRGNFDQAAALVQPLVSAQPDTALFRGLLGAVHLARGNFGQAEQQFLAILANTPRDPVAVKLLAETRLRQQRPAAALATLRTVEDTAAQDAQVGLLSGLASLQLGETERGLLYLEQAASLDPANEMLNLQLARAYLAVGRDADASALLQRSLAAGEDSIDARLLRLFADLRRGAADDTQSQVAELLEEFPREPRVLTAVAINFQLRGDAERARQLFEQAAGLEKDGATARLFVAASLVQEGRREDAERLLREVSAQQPDNAQVLTALAELAVARGAFSDAADLLARAADLSQSVVPRLALAQLRMRTGDRADAGRQIEAAMQSAPDNPEVLAVAGLLSLAEDRVSDAVGLLQRAHEQLPNRLGLTLALARAQLAGDSPEMARATLSRVLAVAPQSLPLRLALGQTELQLGNAAEALTIANALKAEFPTLSGGYLLEAETQIAARRYSAAADTLSNAFEREPAWPVLTRRIGALQLADRPQDALNAAERWAASNPEHLAGRLLFASLLQGAGRNEEALRAFQAVLVLDDKNVPALNNAAWLSNSLARPGALALAEQAYALAGDNPAVLDTLGWILLAEKRETESIAHLSRAAELAPNSAEIRYHLAKAFVAGGRPGEARPILMTLMGIPDFEQRSEAQALLESL